MQTALSVTNKEKSMPLQQRFVFLLLLSIFNFNVFAETTALPDFAKYRDVKQKKSAFFEYMKPKVMQANKEILAERNYIKGLNVEALSAEDKEKFTQLAEKYRVKADDPKNIKAQLLRRVDIIPPSLALAQAANESSWGTSRFAKQAYNFYGQWCFSKGCGLVPNARSKNMKHEVRKFESPYHSVKAYMRNLNTHPAFKNIRDIRANLKQAQKPVTGQALAKGLIKYSERKEHYVKEIQAMIRQNKLGKLDTQAIK